MKKLFGIIAAVAMLAFGTGCERIDTGNVGIKVVQGQISDKELVADPWGYQSFFGTIYEVSTKEITLSFDDVKAKSKDNITMADFDTDVIIKVNPEFAADIYAKYRGDLVDDQTGDAMLVGMNFAQRQIREAIYQAIAQYEAGNMHTKRNELAAEIVRRAQAELDRTAGEKWFTVVETNIRSVVADPALEQSIRAAAQVQFQTAQKEEQKKLAAAEADRLRIEAEGIAESNRIISASLSDRLIELKRIEAQQAFAGQGTHTVLMSGGATPLVQVK